MNRQEQIGLLKRLLHYVETRTTCLADAPWCNDVSVYTDPKHFAREQQVLFRQYPILMGFASTWASPGAYHTDDYADAPILIVRGADNKLRAFLNVCRHRGAKIAQGCGEVRVFSCPYHAWTYDLSGRVTGIPDERCFPGIRPARSSLTELPLCEKHGLVWVIPTPSADMSSGFDIDPWLGGLGPELASRRDGTRTLCPSRPDHARRAHPLGQEHAACPRCRHGRGLAGRTQHTDRFDLGRADADGLWP